MLKKTQFEKAVLDVGSRIKNAEARAFFRIVDKAVDATIAYQEAKEKHDEAAGKAKTARDEATAESDPSAKGRKEAEATRLEGLVAPLKTAMEGAKSKLDEALVADGVAKFVTALEPFSSDDVISDKEARVLADLVPESCKEPVPPPYWQRHPRVRFLLTYGLVALIFLGVGYWGGSRFGAAKEEAKGAATSQREETIRRAYNHVVEANGIWRQAVESKDPAERQRLIDQAYAKEVEAQKSLGE